MNFMLVLDCLLLSVLTFLNLWHWALAMTGHSTVDILCGSKTAANNNISLSQTAAAGGRKKQRLTFRNVTDNLFRIFGTQSFISIFSPSLRGMPFTGIEWTYQARDFGFMEEIESDEEE